MAQEAGAVCRYGSDSQNWTQSSGSEASVVAADWGNVLYTLQWGGAGVDE